MHDVLIAGAGPVGLTLALRLARHGIHATVLEALDTPERDLRASTFHPPTLDLLDEDGITPQLIANGLIAPTWQVRMHATGEAAEFDLSILRGHTHHPYRVQCEQSKLVDFLLARLASAHRHVQVRFGHRVTALETREDGVTMVCETATGVQHFSARYAVGCDGARSAVRKHLGLGFEGETFPENVILAATDFPFHEHLPGLSCINYCWNDDGTFSLLRLPHLWRVSLYPDEGESVDAALADACIERKLQQICINPAGYRIIAKRNYRIHQRVVARYRVGRVILAGDAAHINSPSGGMGMNGGIHDAFNLADKLAITLGAGRATLDPAPGTYPASGAAADQAPLDHYERQRRPVALEHVLAQSGRNRARMQERDPVRRRAALMELQALARDPERALKHLLNTSMITGLKQAEAVP